MKTILLIDDDASVLAIFSLALQQHGFRTITASAGEEGLSMARRHFPDLILCDVNMPGLDGRTVLQALQGDPDLAAKQFVLISGNTFELTPRIGMELGADDFLIKPFSVDALIRCVQARLKRAVVHWRLEDKMIKDLRSNLHSTLPHEFFTPLAGVLGLVDVLRGDITQLREVEINEILDDIQRSGLRLHRTLKNYLLILDFEFAEKPYFFQPLTLTPLQAKEFIAQAVDKAVRWHQRYGDITVSVGETTALRLDPEVATIAEELVENACSFSRKGTPITVELNSTAITVKDQGRGLTQDEIRMIGAFRQFDRNKYEQQGLGLGLVVVQKLATRNGGLLEIRSEPGTSTTATVSFNVSARKSDGAREAKLSTQTCVAASLASVS